MDWLLLSECHPSASIQHVTVPHLVVIQAAKCLKRLLPSSPHVTNIILS